MPDEIREQEPNTPSQSPRGRFSGEIQPEMGRRMVIECAERMQDLGQQIQRIIEGETITLPDAMSNGKRVILGTDEYINFDGDWASMNLRAGNSNISGLGSGAIFFGWQKDAQSEKPSFYSYPSSLDVWEYPDDPTSVQAAEIASEDPDSGKIEAFSTKFNLFKTGDFDKEVSLPEGVQDTRDKQTIQVKTGNRHGEEKLIEHRIVDSEMTVRDLELVDTVLSVLKDRLNAFEQRLK